MTVTISGSDYSELWCESFENAKLMGQFDEADLLFACPSLFGEGHRRRIQLQSGLAIEIADYHFVDELIVLGQDYEANSLEAVFTIADHHQSAWSRTLTSGQNYLVSRRVSGGDSKHFANQRDWHVEIHIEPHLLQPFIQGQPEKLPVDLQQALEGDCDRSFVSPFQTTAPVIQVVLQQILNCPYQGPIQKMYLEGKVFELLALQLEQLTAIRPQRKSSDRLQSGDIDRIYQAREILLQNLDKPSSLLALSRQVGLNDCTLKRGFKRVFGTTVFGYLHDQRMEQARQLLSNGEMNVNEVVRAIGYTSRSAFYTAFRKKFGISPREYLEQSSSLII